MVFFSKKTCETIEKLKGTSKFNQTQQSKALFSSLNETFDPCTSPASSPLSKNQTTITDFFTANSPLENSITIPFNTFIHLLDVLCFLLIIIMFITLWNQATFGFPQLDKNFLYKLPFF